ncbi:putative DNA-binding transcriptional regulator [Cupriavidus taiwanensis]|uniref:type II TA system antitoxin MqsA family protein n=1 Tax=Cupriavidus taiwanensis TaxID=164546 RepID=UPI000E1B3924|nr:type II TA system antitoxin MqsA family protein [Cupriavidus taiwanensis]SOZ98630.1 putative DNA-binding transcriptional regulator [Cupriavidus taiwanensis]
MRCPTCGGAELVAGVRDVQHTYRGETTVIEQVRGEFCPACGEYLTDFEESDRVMKRMNAFNREVNAAFVDPAYIVSVRKKLRLDQREAGEIFGGGVNGFSRYETGKTKPPLALIKLLKLLDHHPELLAEIRAA